MREIGALGVERTHGGTAAGRSRAGMAHGICDAREETLMKPYCQNRRPAGFNLLEALVVIGIFAVLIVVLLFPSLSRSTARAQPITCVNNLKQVGLSFRQWALDNNDRYPMSVSVTNGGAMELAATGQVFPVFQVMSNELNTPMLLICPEDKVRIPAQAFSQLASDSNVSYFVGLDAADIHWQRVLTGDDNLLINGQPRPRGVALIGTNTLMAWSAQRHINRGNVALADGSVQQVSSARPSAAFQAAGLATNRLIFP